LAVDALNGIGYGLLRFRLSARLMPISCAIGALPR